MFDRNSYLLIFFLSKNNLVGGHSGIVSELIVGSGEQHIEV